jgi:hypothetical protein
MFVKMPHLNIELRAEKESTHTFLFFFFFLNVERNWL